MEKIWKLYGNHSHIFLKIGIGQRNFFGRDNRIDTIYLYITLLGYMVDVIKSTYQDRDKGLPKFNILGQSIAGLKVAIIFSIHFYYYFYVILYITPPQTFQGNHP